MTETALKGPMRAGFKSKIKAFPPSLANEPWQDRSGQARAGQDKKTI